ncbi:MAG: hypothetical protein IPL61_13390 [Myxococcales bacterium]|nr:hypothetical protein [Myxococcales bacterium]
MTSLVGLSVLAAPAAADRRRRGHGWHHRHHARTVDARRRAPTPPLTPAPAAPIAPATPALFGIGGGEDDPRTHVAFDAPGELVAASARVVVDRVAPTGLNFFALQVNFNNGTWAHGGLQDVDGPAGTRTRQINWGGLVNRGGGSADYEQQDDRADLARIQNPPVGQHLGPYAWRTGVAYEYLVERGARVRLPAGDYRLIPGRPLVRVAKARTMYEWRFTVRPVAGDGPTFVAVLYDAADAITSFYLWNESGYGSTDAAQHTRWWAPRYVEAGASGAREPAAWHRF